MLAEVVLTTVALSFASQEEQSEQRLPSNLEVIQQLSQHIGDSLARLLEYGDSIRVYVRPIESAWYVEGAILKAFSDHGQIPTQSLSAVSEVDIGLLHARVEYANARRHGIFTKRVLDRTVSVEIAGKIVDKRSGAIVLNRNFVQSVSDTVDVSDVEKLENAGIPATRGVLPREEFFSSILEPLVTIGTIAVAVFLLFRVRS